MILCISHSADFYTIDLVIEHLQKAGKEVLRLNSDMLNDQMRFEYRIRDGKSVLVLHTEGKSVSAEEIEAVWYRKLWGIKTPAELSGEYVTIFNQEYYSMRDIFFNALSSIPWMNPIETDHQIGNDKLYQLSVAEACGMLIPETIFTNDQERVTSFFHHECSGQMIAKLHGSLSRSMKGDQPFLPTTRIKEEDLNDLDSLVYCPMIFQRMIEKSYELRVIYVDGHFFTGKINAQASEKGSVDWRAAHDIFPAWESYQLPASIETKLTMMMKRFGLYFGAFDLICDTQGNYVFLEINPQGEWGMLQRDLNYPIAQTIADQLIQRVNTHSIVQLANQ